MLQNLVNCKVFEVQARSWKTWSVEVYIRLRIKYGQTLEFQLLIFPLVWTTRTTAVAQPKPMPKPSEGLLKKSGVHLAHCSVLLWFNISFNPWFTAATATLRYISSTFLRTGSSMYKDFWWGGPLLTKKEKEIWAVVWPFSKTILKCVQVAPFQWFLADSLW